MSTEYVTVENDAYRITGTRVSLDSLVYAYHRGASPESIQRSFPSVTLEQVHGALAFYLAHKSEVDTYLACGEADFEKLSQVSRETHSEWHDKLRRARDEALASQS
jgi:uncharacterized protein (DUF433 family)